MGRDYIRTLLFTSWEIATSAQIQFSFQNHCHIVHAGYRTAAANSNLKSFVSLRRLEITVMGHRLERENIILSLISSIALGLAPKGVRGPLPR